MNKINITESKGCNDKVVLKNGLLIRGMVSKPVKSLSDTISEAMDKDLQNYLSTSRKKVYR